jgi:hypothetical protein
MSTKVKDKDKDKDKDQAKDLSTKIILAFSPLG